MEKNKYIVIKNAIKSREYLYGHLLLIVLLNLATGAVYALHFISNNTLYWDNYRLFSVFRENLHSLNYYGEIQWWHPRIQSGFPIYYFSILGCNTTTPLFALTAFVAWFLGKIGVIISSYHTFYVIYFASLVPLLFSLGLYSLARRIFADNKTLIFVIICGAFSPGVVFNLSDNGLEQTAYGLFFASTFLGFLDKPCRKSFLSLTLSFLVLAVSFNHLSLYWNILFIPLFVIACISIAERPFKDSLIAIPLRYWLVLSMLVIICTLPSLITYYQGKDIMRSKIEARVYEYESLRSGNPLEALSVSTPGIGYEWFESQMEGTVNKTEIYTATTYREISTDYHEYNHMGYVYMGMLALPLSIIGLLWGRDPWRLRILLMLLSMTCVFMLSGYSPIFSAVLALPTPFRAVNHYSDTLFRNGVFLLIIITSGLGIEALFKNLQGLFKTFLVITSLTFVFSSFVFGLTYGPALKSVPATYIALAIAVTYALALILSRFFVRRLFLAFTLVVMVDLLAFSVIHVKDVMWGNDKEVYEPPVHMITRPDSSYANDILVLQKALKWINSGLVVLDLPETELFYSAESVPIENYADGKTIKGYAPGKIVLSGEYEGKPDFGEFLKMPDRGNSYGYIEGTGWTYNSRRFTVSVERKSILFLKDSYFPGWSATVNGKMAEIAEAFWVFKAIVVPEGTSTVEFRFSPGMLPYALMLSYGALLSVFVVWVFHSRQVRKITPKRSLISEEAMSKTHETHTTP